MDSAKKRTPQDLRQKVPLSEYSPMKTSWRRNSELNETELETLAKIGLIVVGAIIVFLVWWNF